LHTLTGHTSQIHRVAISPDGRRILTMSYDSTARLWDGKNGRLIEELRAQAGEIVVGAFSADSTRVVTAAQFGNGIAHVWDALSGAPITRLRGHRASVDEVAFSSNGRLIASASTDGTTRVWTAPQGTAHPAELLTQACVSLRRYHRTFDRKEVADLGLPFSPDGESPCDRAGILSSKWWSKLFNRF
jgi:WD40 repeat protein